MGTRLVLALVLTAMLCRPARSLGWDKQGHMVVAYIAYVQLKHDDPQLLAKLIARFDDLPNHDKLLAALNHPTPDTDLNKFLAMATWPDAIKRNPFTHKLSPVDDSKGAYPKSHEAWHYVNYPLVRGAAPGQPVAPDGVNAVKQVQDQVDALFTSSMSASDRAKALCWVEHLVGDLHQPLHCVALIDPESEFDPPHGDSGGNKIAVDTDDKELHAFWDNLVGVGLSLTQAKSQGDEILSAFPASGFSAADIKAAPGAWAAESYKLAHDKAYTVLEGVPDGRDLRNTVVQITPEYENQAQRTAERQVALAGVRLAAYLRAHEH